MEIGVLHYVNKKIDILGSCVSRDPFAMFEHQYEINNYFARTNVISLASKPMKISIYKILLDSNFQKRSVYNDLNKQFFKYLEEVQSNVLIIDLLSERLRLMKRGETYFTLSDEFNKSNLMQELKGKAVVQKTDEMWEAAAKQLVAKLNESKYDQVIIHKAFWQERYIDANGDIQSFENIDEIHENNKKLDFMYKYLGENVSKASYLEITDEEIFADENHKWGLSPRHYETSYYEKFLNELKYVLA
nr:DUF6270 domain-containing protein [Priestia flexa]